MQRELKFRIWDLKNKKFIDEDPFYSKWAVSLDGKPYNGKYDYKYNEDECIIQQYTGMKDKNGKEIYESDIVKGLHYFGPAGFHERIMTVYFNNIEGSYGWNYWDTSTLEVIGNNFENTK
jgi:uncharacterized phage protein (TIGR01671 family)